MLISERDRQLLSVVKKERAEKEARKAALRRAADPKHGGTWPFEKVKIQMMEPQKSESKGGRNQPQDAVLESAATRLVQELGIPFDKAMEALIKAKAELALLVAAKEAQQTAQAQKTPEIGATVPQEGHSGSPLVNLPREAIRAAVGAIQQLLKVPGAVYADPPKKARKKRISKEKFQKPKLIKEAKEAKKTHWPLKPLKSGYSGSLNLTAAVNQARKEEAEKE